MGAAKLTISVPASDAELLKAYQISPSLVCQPAIRAAIEAAEGESRTIVVPTSSGFESFQGRWIIDPNSDDAKTTHLRDKHGVKLNDEEDRWGVAISDHGAMVYYMPRTGHLRCGPGLAQSTVPHDIQERVLELMKEPGSDKPTVIPHPDW